jgi:hypothetical protein
MRSIVCWVTVVGLLAGCAIWKPKHEQVKVSEPEHKRPVVTQETMLVGKVISVKADLGFAVLNFPVGSVPGFDRHLSVYRQGVKIGEVKVTGPQQEDNIVGDIVSGQVQPGDEIRAD